MNACQCIQSSLFICTSRNKALQDLLANLGRVQNRENTTWSRSSSNSQLPHNVLIVPPPGLEVGVFD